MTASLKLIKKIKGIAYKFESQKNIYLALHNAKCAFYAYKQGADETNANYMSKFKNTIEVIEHYGGTLGEDKALVLKELKSAGCNNDTASTEEIETAMDLARHKMHAIGTLQTVDYGPGESIHKRYQSIPNEHYRDFQSTLLY